MGIMLVYDITNEKTFENIVKWLRNIDEVSIVYFKHLEIYLCNFFKTNDCHIYFLQHANEDVEKMILGNKSDMEERRVVSTEKGEAVNVLYRYYF